MGFETPPPAQKPQEGASVAPKEALAAGAAAPAKPDTKRPELEAEFPELAALKPRDDAQRAEEAVDVYARTVDEAGSKLMQKAEESRNAMIAKMRATG